MRVLVVGSTSVIGSAIRGDLARAGLEVVTAGRRDADIPLDLSDVGVARSGRPRAFAGEAFDVVVNTAAAVGGPGQPADLVRRVNVAGARVVAEIACASGARRLVHFSTVYAGFHDRYPGPAVYAETKAAGEAEVGRFASRAGLPLAVLRPTHVYDTAGRCRPNQELPYRFAELAAAGKDIVVHGTGRARRDYLHLDDLVRAVHHCVRAGAAGTHVLGSPRTMTLLEIAGAAQAAFGSAGTIRLAEDRSEPAGMPPLDDAGWRALGLHPRVDLAAGFALLRAAGAQ